MCGNFYNYFLKLYYPACRSLTALRQFKAREYHVFFLYVSLAVTRCLEEADFESSEVADVGRKIMRAWKNLLCALHLVKGFSTKVCTLMNKNNSITLCISYKPFY